MHVELMNYPANADLLCGEAAAICTGSDRELAALKGAMGSGHESVAEHASFTFYVKSVSRVLLAQLTRHRIASFSVQSQRYCGVNPEWIVPPSVIEKGMETAYRAMCDACYNLFCTMLTMGIPEEDARYVIPQGVTCNLVMTMNARELRHFFSLRMCNRAQWEIRNLADAMHEMSVEHAPILFEDSGAGCMTSKGCPEKRPCGTPRKKVEA